LQGFYLRVSIRREYAHAFILHQTILDQRCPLVTTKKHAPSLEHAFCFLLSLLFCSFGG
jgi:hypothetical protein